jgi:hypothetical protein
MHSVHPWVLDPLWCSVWSGSKHMKMHWMREWRVLAAKKEGCSLFCKTGPSFPQG